MLQQLAFHAQKIIPATSVQDLNPRPCADNAHASVLPFEMAAIENAMAKFQLVNWLETFGILKPYQPSYNR
jgi:hypothetical protein